MTTVVAHSISGRRWLRAWLVMIATIAAVLWSAAPASAHDVLVSSDPAADAVLANPPTTVTLVFNQAVQNVYAELAVTIGSQPPVEFSPTVSGRTVTADLSAEHLPAPGPAAAVVGWKIGFRIVSADGHPVSGLLTFSVGRPLVPSSAVPAQLPAAGSRIAPWMLIAGVVGLALLVGTAVLLIRRRPTPAE